MRRIGTETRRRGGAGTTAGVLYYLGPDGDRQVVMQAAPIEDAQRPVLLGYYGTEYERRGRPRPIRHDAAIVWIVLFAAACLATTWAWLWMWNGVTE